MKLQMLEEFMVFAGAMTTLLCGTAIGAVWIRSRARQVAAGDPTIAPRLEEISKHLAQLENVMESTAIEVERISEGQRFTTKLLAERSVTPATAPAMPERSRPVGSTTPH